MQYVTFIFLEFVICDIAVYATFFKKCNFFVSKMYDFHQVVSPADNA